MKTFLSTLVQTVVMATTVLFCAVLICLVGLYGFYTTVTLQQQHNILECKKNVSSSYSTHGIYSSKYSNEICDSTVEVIKPSELLSALVHR